MPIFIHDSIATGHSMIEAYLPLLLIIGIAVIFGIIGANLSWLVGPARPYREKMTTYESGMTPVRTAHERFSVKYYMVAVLFILFDIEVVFMYPWAVQYRNLGLFGFVEMMVFIGILLVGFLYILKKGALRWD